jgi:hypothetical protein
MQATFWGLPSNPGDDSRAVLHTLVGVLHSAPLGEERSEKKRGKGVGISADSLSVHKPGGTFTKAPIAVSLTPTNLAL